MAVRLGRSERFGQLACGGCSEAQRDELRCPLRLTGKDRKGETRRPPREPAQVPTYRVEMGPSARAALFTQCPVGVALTDDVARYLSAYALVKRWGKWPPGRDNPRLLEALTLIEREHDLITMEQAPK